MLNHESLLHSRTYVFFLLWKCPYMIVLLSIGLKELSLKNCVKMLPVKAEEINQNFEKQGLKILKMQINCVKSNSIAS